MVNILMSNMSLDKRWCRLELRDYIKPSSRVTIVGFQFYQEPLTGPEHWDEFYHKEKGAFYSYLIKPFEFFGIAAKSIKWINYFTDTPLSAQRKIKNSDVLVFTDGLAKQMMEVIDLLEIKEAIKDYKGTIIGYGNGSLIQLSNCSGNLGLVDGLSVKVSFDELDLTDDSMKDFDNEYPIYAISDDGAVVVDNGRISTLGDVYVIKNEKTE